MPYERKCFRCHQVGHVGRNCPVPPWNIPAGPQAPPPASAPAAEVHPHAGNGTPPLIYAEELDQGFEPLAGDYTLAEAAAVDFVPSVVGASDEVVVVENVSVPSAGEASTIEVVDSGSSPPIVLDKLYNQLDEMPSHRAYTSMIGKAIDQSMPIDVC